MFRDFNLFNDVGKYLVTYYFSDTVLIGWEGQ